MRPVLYAATAAMLLAHGASAERARSRAVVVVFEPNDDCDSPNLAREIAHHRHAHRHRDVSPRGVINVEIVNAEGAAAFDPVFVKQNPNGQCLVGARGTLHFWGGSSHVRITLGAFPEPAAWNPDPAKAVTVSTCYFVGGSTQPTCHSAPELFDEPPTVNDGVLKFGVSYEQGKIYEYTLRLKMGGQDEVITGPGYSGRHYDDRRIDPMIINH